MVFPVDGVAGMPTEGDDTAPLMLCDYFLPHDIERHPVEVLVRTQFESSQVESHDSGEVTADFEHIASSVFVFPCGAIYRIILMTDEHAPPLQSFQSVEQYRPRIRILCA